MTFQTEATVRQKMIKRMVQVLYTTAIQAAVLFLAAGTLKWAWGWGFIGVYLVGILINAVMLFRANPVVIAERADRERERMGPVVGWTGLRDDHAWDPDRSWPGPALGLDRTHHLDPYCRAGALPDRIGAVWQGDGLQR